MKKVGFYFVRHGQTLFNVEHTLQGSCDSPLTAQGIAQAQQTSLALREVPFTRAYSSSSERAVDTAEIILARHNVPLIRTKELKEFDFGTYDGRNLKIPGAAEEVSRRIKAGFLFRDVGGEDLEMVEHRVLRVFNAIAQECGDHERVLIVSHGCFELHVIRTLLHADTEVVSPFRRAGTPFPIANGSILVFMYKDGLWQLVRYPVPAEKFQDPLWKEVE